MEEIKEKAEEMVKDRGFVATIAAIGIGLLTKKFSKDATMSIGTALVAYSVVKKIP